jgi:chaperonin cofactor prefoldin
VEHESRLAALAENRAAAVLEARLEGLSVRLSRIEASTEAINQKLDTYR